MPSQLGPEQWRRLEDMFHEVADLPPGEQARVLADKCDGDPEMHDQMRAMLGEDSKSRGFLESDLPALAHNLLGDTYLNPGGARFGSYRVIRMLGRGGMGIVYLAERTDLGNPVAIKVLPDAALSSARLERFAVERQVLARLNHPSIGRLYDAGTLPDGSPYMVMEYVDGPNLTAYCLLNDFSIRTILSLFRSVCEAVQFAHSHALIHRDLKPSNILVTTEGAVKLLDFGLAKSIDERSSLLNSTITGLRMMTPAYAAPEQLQRGQASIRTDVYALGVILYELLTRRLPFDLSTLSPGEAEQVILTREPAPPSQNRYLGDGGRQESGAVWNDLDVLCLVAMHKDPARRYQSVEALIRDIDHHLRNEPLEARPDNFTYVLGKFIQRNQAVLLTAAAVLITIVGLIAFFGVRLTRARNDALAEAGRTQRIQQLLTHLFDAGKGAGPSADLRAVDLLDRGAREARTLYAEPQIQAELLQTIGDLYDKLGRFERADTLLSSALAIRKRVFGPISIPVAETMATLAAVKADEGNFAPAVKLGQQSLAIDARVLPAGSFTAATHKILIGGVLVNAAQFPQALKTLTEAVDVLSRPGAPRPDFAKALDFLGTAYFESGDSAHAEKAFKRALAVERQIYASGEELIAEEQVNLASIAVTREHWQEAERLYRQGLANTISWYGENNATVSEITLFLGQTLLKEGQLDEAQNLLERALAMNEKSWGAGNRITAINLNALGVLYARRGNLAKAEQSDQRVADIAQKLFGQNSPLALHAIYNLSDLNRRMKKFPQAEKYIAQAIAAAGKLSPPNQNFSGTVQIGLGRLLMDEKRYHEAETPLVNGYNLLATEQVPGLAMLQTARQALAEDYGYLRRPELARKYRGEFNRFAKTAAH